jgi:5-formyltetrahydrofolate cyclo-ligase
MAESEAKAELRRVVRQSRNSRTPSHLSDSMRSFTDHLTSVAADLSWTRIAAFLPTPTEPPITQFLTDFLDGGGSCVVPESGVDGTLSWHTLERGFESNLVRDSQGMPIPAKTNPTVLGDVDAVLVPAAAVDREGNRLGWGKGYYDRFLDSIDSSTVVIAVVFDSDVLDDIPAEPHDKTVNLIVTERDIYRARD